MQIWAKRQQIDEIVNSFKIVKLFFSCLTALECSSIRQHVKNQIEKPGAATAEIDLDGFEDSDKYIPGKSIV